MNYKNLCKFFLTLLPLYSVAQTTYLPIGDKQEIILNRLEIKAQRDSVLNFSKMHPYSREQYVDAARKYLHDDSASVNLTEIDKYYLNSLMRNNTEWLTEEERIQYASKKSIWNTFYKNQANLYETHIKDFDFIVNPMLNAGIMKESGNDQNLFYNTRGVSFRGLIAGKVGFAGSLSDNQERYPLYVQDWMNERTAVPGEGYWKSFKGKGGVDYFDARGYITFGVTKYIDVAFGYDKNFIGNGFRSLFLSDFSNNTLFLKLNTRIGRFNYQNLFMELTNAYVRGGDKLLGKKYAAMHHLDIDVAKWLNIGLFEGVVFGRENKFEFGYLVPVIFLRSVERNNGSSDNALVGLDFKANAAKTAQFYGQLMFDEFKLKEMTSNRGWWANKWGIQLGGKYIDAFTVKNLDLQVEWNHVRPFSYSHRDSVANYSHYNQPLAHPLMANFNELMGLLRYRPFPKWSVEGRGMFYTQGRDSTANENFGYNLFLPYGQGRISNYGYKVGSGWKTQAALAQLLVSYELIENLFIDVMGQIRKERTTTDPKYSKSSTVFGLGVRWNMARRDFFF